MALNNFDNLKARLVDQSHRNDLTPDRLADFIQQAEQSMYSNPIEPLEIREFEKTSTQDTAADSSVLALPSDYLSMRAIRIDDKSTGAQQYELTYTSPETLFKDPASGMPSFFTVTNQIEFNRPCDAIYNVEMKYLGSLTALSDANTTNDILTNYPNIYMYGALRALNQWAERFDLAEYYFNEFIKEIRGANKQDWIGRYGPAPVITYDGHIV